jgi:hypothetical protein
MRVILGPWRWMLIIYSYEEPPVRYCVLALTEEPRPAAADLAGTPRYGSRRSRRASTTSTTINVRPSSR